MQTNQRNVYIKHFPPSHTVCILETSNVVLDTYIVGTIIEEILSIMPGVYMAISLWTDSGQHNSITTEGQVWKCVWSEQGNCVGGHFFLQVLSAIEPIRHGPQNMDIFGNKKKISVHTHTLENAYPLGHSLSLGKGVLLLNRKQTVCSRL